MASTNRLTKPAHPKASLDTHPTVEANAWSRTIQEVNADSLLRVVGASSLHLTGRRVDVRPPLAYQVLLALALEADHSLTRHHLGCRLFSHLDSAKRGPQVRLVLQRLKLSLAQHDLLEEIIEFKEGGLRLRLPIQVDAEILCSTLTTCESLRQLGHQILPGHSSRFAVKYRNTIKGRIEIALSQIWTNLNSQDEISDFISILEALRDQYLISAPIRAHLCGAYKKLHRYDELTREILHFESEWLDVYGHFDKPDIAALASQIAES